MRWFALDTRTGKKLVEEVLDEKEPGQDKNLQDRIQILQMPVGLPDILSADEKYIYMKSQKFDDKGKRYDLGPHSGDFAGQGGPRQAKAGQARPRPARAGYDRPRPAMADQGWPRQATAGHGRP